MFLKCIKFGVSLNPKKSHFALEEGKLLGHIISKDGIRIDPTRVEAIGRIALPKNKKEVQSFIGKVNSLRRFIIDCAEAGVEDIDINFLDICNVSDQTHQDPDIFEDFLASPWYRDIIYVIKNLQAPPELTGTKARSVKLKSSRYCIINGFLY